ncbi:MAG TPA: alpha/beta fold hydrolase [Chloroflexia bacterium]|nr:alpha/beta fold hydrolase [Chloroflexia bacterium]
MKNSFTLALPALKRLHRADDPNRYVDVDGVRVRYVEEGADNGGPPVLLLHGYNGSCDYWYPHGLPELARERHMLAIDLPGNGLSGKLAECSLDSYVSFMVAFMDTLGIPIADIMGHSMGGQVAIAAAARHPERFRKLVLVDSAGLPELIGSQWVAPLKMLTDSSLRHVRMYPTFIKIGMRARVAREGLRILRLQSIRRELKALSLPTLVLWGSRDRVVPLEHGAFMAKHIPGARLVVVRGAGHMPFYEKPEECARVVLAFLREDVKRNA